MSKESPTPIITDTDKIIETGLRNGLIYKEIANLIDQDETYITKRKKVLVDNNIITNEDIKQAKKMRKMEEYLSDPMVPKILKYLRDGFSQQNIADLLGLTRDNVKLYVHNLIDFGLITSDEIKIAKDRYIDDIKEDNLLYDKILELLKDGISISDIAKDVDMTWEGIKKVQNKLIETGKITSDEIQEAANEREKQRDKEIVKLLKQGFTYEEIIRKFNVSNNLIVTLENQAISDGIFTKQERDKNMANREPEQITITSDVEQTVLNMLKKR